MRRKLLEEMYDSLSDEDKRTFVLLTMQDKGYKDIMQAIQSQEKKLDEIGRKQSWWLDLTSNLAGNALFDGAIWLGSKLFKKL